MAQKTKKPKTPLVKEENKTKKFVDHTKGGDHGSRGRKGEPRHVPGPGESGR